MDLRLHLGAHKTASTHFEQLLLLNDPLLRSNGTVHVRKSRYHDVFLASIWAELGGREAPAEWAGIKSMLAAEEGTLFLSAENLLGTTEYLMDEGVLYPSLSKILSTGLAMLEPDDLSIMICLRDLAGFLPSAWMEASRSRDVGSFKTYIEGLGAKTNWRSVIERIHDIAPLARLHVWTFDAYRADPGRFVPLAYGKPAGSPVTLTPLNEVIRPSPSLRAIKEIAKLRETLDREAWTSEIDSIVERFPRSTRFPGPRPWNEDESEFLARCFSSDLGAIAELPHVTLMT